MRSPYLAREAVLQKITGGLSLAGASLRAGGIQRRAAAPTDAELGQVRARFPDELVGRVVPFVISTGERLDDGYALDPAGCDHEQYDRAPIVLQNHDRWGARVADSVIVEGTKEVSALACFYPREFSQALDGGVSWAMGELAALRGYRASIGFQVVEATVASEEVRKTIPWALDVGVWRLREWSVLNLGMDPDAISAGRDAGVDTSPLADLFGRFLDEATAAGLDREALERAWLAAAGPRPVVVDSRAAEPAPLVEPTASDLRALFAVHEAQLSRA